MNTALNEHLRPPFFFKSSYQYLFLIVRPAALAFFTLRGNTHTHTHNWACIEVSFWGYIFFLFYKPVMILNILLCVRVWPYGMLCMCYTQKTLTIFLFIHPAFRLAFLILFLWYGTQIFSWLIKFPMYLSDLKQPKRYKSYSITMFSILASSSAP